MGNRFYSLALCLPHYLRMQSDRTSAPISVHGGSHVADLLVLKLQLPLYWPSVITKQPEMLARALSPVDLKPSAVHARLQSSSGTGVIPERAHRQSGSGGGAHRRCKRRCPHLA